MDTTLTVAATGNAPSLLLRPWTHDDVPALVAAHRDPLIRRWLRHPMTTVEQARQAIGARQADIRAGTAFSFAVLAAADGSPGDLVGGVSLRGVGGAAVNGEVGYWVAAAARGRGVAPRALRAMCDWAFGSSRFPVLERLRLIHTVGNEASCRVAGKAGFALSTLLPPLPPEFPHAGHLHIRPRADAGERARKRHAGYRAAPGWRGLR
ncbi:MAG TPA: GNAT family N-acetyltransferase [Streptosporangiaceae bacterium]|jgi:RimJ/RimL family protein N-acetyltransferase